MKRAYFKRRTKAGVSKSKTDLHRKAWDVFSKWIRNRDKQCVTCGTRVTLQAGHFWHACLDFDEININAQCSGCNHFKSGNLAVYSAYLINKYGVKAFKDLEMRHYRAMRGEYRTEADYLKLIEKYKLSTGDEINY